MSLSKKKIEEKILHRILNTINNSYDLFSNPSTRKYCFSNGLAYKHISIINEDIEMLDLLDCAEFTAGSLTFDAEHDGSSCRLSYSSSFVPNFPKESFKTVLVIDWVINWGNVQKMCEICDLDFKEVSKGMFNTEGI